MKLDTSLLYAEADALGVNVQLPRTPFTRYGRVRVPFQLSFSLTWSAGDNEQTALSTLALRVLWLKLHVSVHHFTGLPDTRSLTLSTGLQLVGARYWWATIPEPKPREPFTSFFAETILPAIDDIVFKPSPAAADARPDWERRGYASYLDYLSRCDIVGKTLAANAAFQRDYEKQFGPDPHIGQDPHNRNIVIVGDDDLPLARALARSLYEDGRAIERHSGTPIESTDAAAAEAWATDWRDQAFAVQQTQINWFDPHGCQVPVGSYLDRVYEIERGDDAVNDA